VNRTCLPYCLTTLVKTITSSSFRKAEHNTEAGGGYQRVASMSIHWSAAASCRTPKSNLAKKLALSDCES
jgi:hypothetical protein